MLTGKTKKLYDLLDRNIGEWVSIRECVNTLWGDSSFDSKEGEIKWRRNLAGQISYMKSKLEENYAIEKSKSLDAIKLIDTKISGFYHKLSSTCLGCGSLILTAKENTDCSYCIDCLCMMMEDLGL